MSEITQPRFIGMTAQAASASTQLTSGASRNTPLLAPEGMIGSFSTNFKRSAKDCSRPKGPTTLGPRRICTAAQILRSARMTAATDSIRIRQMIKMKTFWLRNQRGTVVVRQLHFQHFGQRTQDRPVFLGFARREGGAAAALHPAFEVDIDAVLFGIGGTRQDHIGMMGPGIAMAALIDHKGAAQMG